MRRWFLAIDASGEGYAFVDKETARESNPEAEIVEVCDSGMSQAYEDIADRFYDLRDMKHKPLLRAACDYREQVKPHETDTRGEYLGAVLDYRLGLRGNMPRDTGGDAT